MTPPNMNKEKRFRFLTREELEDLALVDEGDNTSNAVVAVCLSLPHGDLNPDLWDEFEEGLAEWSPESAGRVGNNKRDAKDDLIALGWHEDLDMEIDESNFEGSY